MVNALIGAGIVAALFLYSCAGHWLYQITREEPTEAGVLEVVVSVFWPVFMLFVLIVAVFHDLPKMIVEKLNAYVEARRNRQ